MMEYELSVAFILSKPCVLNRASYILWVLLVSGKIHEKRKKKTETELFPLWSAYLIYTWNVELSKRFVFCIELSSY